MAAGSRCEYTYGQVSSIEGPEPPTPKVNMNLPIECLDASLPAKRCFRWLASTSRQLAKPSGFFLASTLGLTLWLADEPRLSAFPNTTVSVSQEQQDENPKNPTPLQPQDRLTLIGGTMIERLQLDGRLEAALYHTLGSNSFQVRNIGWSGDDVWGTARAVFGQPSDGFERLKSDLKLTQPSVVVVAYGANESFAGPSGLEKFREGLSRLLEMIIETGGRPILVTPPPFEELGPPLPSMRIANENLSLYCRTIRELAAQQNLSVIDLNSKLAGEAKSTPTRTENGVHLSDAGTSKVSQVLAQELLGRPISDDQWTRLSISVDLLSLIRQKNEWFFHRYRPQNETYLFLFRKHEQGNNAVEIPQFDVFIDNAEQEIRRMAIGLSPK